MYWKRTLRSIEEGTFRRGTDAAMPTANQKIPLPSTPKTPTTAPTPPKAGGDAGEREVYEKYINARKQCNEATKGLSFEGFQKAINTQKQKLAQTRGTKDVDVKVSVKDGKAKLTITSRKKTG